MAIRKVILTERELTRLIKRIVVETKHEKEMEMEEGWLSDKLSDVKRKGKKYFTGYGDEGERESKEEEFYTELDNIESEIMSNMEDFKYKDESEWERTKERLIKNAEENNFLGRLKTDYARRTGKGFVTYIEGKSRFKKGLEDLGSGAGSAARSYQSRGTSNS